MLNFFLEIQSIFSAISTPSLYHVELHTSNFHRTSHPFYSCLKHIANHLICLTLDIIELSQWIPLTYCNKVFFAASSGHRNSLWHGIGWTFCDSWPKFSVKRRCTQQVCLKKKWPNKRRKKKEDHTHDSTII